MAGLQVLEEQYGDQGFHVLGFYSDDFNQGGSDEDIEACTEANAVTFQQFVIGSVTDPNPRPVFAWLLSQPNPGPKPDPLQPTWNFHKYLVSRDGELIATFGQQDYMGTDPTSSEWQNHPIVAAIEFALGE